MSLRLQIHQAILKFFKPLGKKCRFWTILISLIIGIALYISVDIVTAEVVRQNSYDIHMLAAKMLIEHGPDYTKQSGKKISGTKDMRKNISTFWIAVGSLATVGLLFLGAVEVVKRKWPNGPDLGPRAPCTCTCPETQTGRDPIGRRPRLCRRVGAVLGLPPVPRGVHGGGPPRPNLRGWASQHLWGARGLPNPLLPLGGRGGRGPSLCVPRRVRRARPGR